VFSPQRNLTSLLFVSFVKIPCCNLGGQRLEGRRLAGDSVRRVPVERGRDGAEVQPALGEAEHEEEGVLAGDARDRSAARGRCFRSCRCDGQVEDRLRCVCVFITRGNMERFCGKQLLVWKFELDAVGFFKTKFTGE
jgi:hypothetical protein